MKSILPITFCFFLIALVSLTSVEAKSRQKIKNRNDYNNHKFMCGVSGTNSYQLAQQQMLQSEMHVTHIRRYFMWSSGQSTVSKSTFEYNLTVAAVQANPQKYVTEWSQNSVNWGTFDNEIANMCSRLNASSGRPITPILEVFEGTTWGLPVFVENRSEYVDPCTVGIPSYNAHAYRWVRAVTERYTNLIIDTCGTSSPIFQIENEFNEAFLSIFYGQRKFCLQWVNFTFMTQHLGVLRQAVKDGSGGEANSPVRVTQNLHTDVPKVVHDLVGLPGFYTEAVAMWNSVIDIWSLDAYPNMIIASPMRAYKIKERINNVTAITNNTKEVFIMETGFPRINENLTPLPPKSPSNWSVLDFSAANQAMYSQYAIESTLAANGSGILFFQVGQSNGMSPPQGGYELDDLELFTEIQQLLETHNVTSFIDWVLSPFSNHLTILLNRAGTYLHRPDDQDGWALLDQQGKPVPAFKSIAPLYSQICG